jgi:ABC-2 type transport system ATP-binding protein
MSKPALTATGLGKRYGSRWALRDCTLEIPAGSVTALVGPNGAGKTTLLHLAVGISDPTVGEIDVLGWSARQNPQLVLPRVGFVAQDHPLYNRFAVGEMVKASAKLNARWDYALAESRLERLGIPLAQKVGTLSGGQQAQVALTLALAKRPELLVLDEPAASLDPLARREFLQSLMEAVAENGLTVILSSHIVADLERVCDHLVVLSASEVQLAGPIEEVIRSHRVLTGPRSDISAVERVHAVIHESHTERQTTLVIRANGHVYDARWQIDEVGLEELVLAYLGRQARQPAGVYEELAS